MEDAGVRLGVAVLARLGRRDGDDLAGAVLDDDVATLADLAGLHRDDLRRAGVGILERLVGVTHGCFFLIDTPTGNLERPVLGGWLENFVCCRFIATGKSRSHCLRRLASFRMPQLFKQKQPLFLLTCFASNNERLVKIVAVAAALDTCEGTQ